MPRSDKAKPWPVNVQYLLPYHAEFVTLVGRGVGTQQENNSSSNNDQAGPQGGASGAATQSSSKFCLDVSQKAMSKWALQTIGLPDTSLVSAIAACQDTEACSQMPICSRMLYNNSHLHDAALMRVWSTCVHR